MRLENTKKVQHPKPVKQSGPGWLSGPLHWTYADEKRRIAEVAGADVADFGVGDAAHAFQHLGAVIETEAVKFVERGGGLVSEGGEEPLDVNRL